MKRKYIILLIMILILLILIPIILNKLFSKSSVKQDEKESEVIFQEESGEESIIDIYEETESFFSVVDSLNGYKKTDQEMQNNYEIKNLDLKREERITYVTGSIKNKGLSSNIILKAEFYTNDGNVIGSSSIPMDLTKGDFVDFEIRILSNVSSDVYKVFVDYVGE